MLWSTASLLSTPMSSNDLPDYDLALPRPPPSSGPDALMTSSPPARDGQALDQTASMHPPIYSAPDAGAFFPAAQNFTVSGGNFTSNVQQILPRELPPGVLESLILALLNCVLDFRTIPLGDIDLQAELGAESSGYLHPHRRERSVRVVRTMYSAKVEGREMTAVLYQGDEQAKEDWMKEVKNMSSVRHPNLLQLFGIASSGRTHVAIYHGGLISMDHMLHYHRDNPMMRVNIRVQLSAEFRPAFDSLMRLVHDRHGPRFGPSLSYFFRTSTGRLCIAVDPSGYDTIYPPPIRFLIQQLWPSNPVNLSSLVESAPIDQLHRFISYTSGQQWLQHQLMTPHPTLFAVTSGGSYVALAMLNSYRYPVQWKDRTTLLPVESTRLRNGWERYSIGPEKAGQRVQISNRLLYMMDTIWWSQAGHIFNLLNIRDKFDSYFLAYGPPQVEFTVPEGAPNGYLFYVPPLQKKPFQFFWSLDPLGREQLSWKEARTRGFPRLIFSKNGYRQQWDTSMYEEVRAIHIAKGFDPDSQDIARHLGYPLFELVSDIKARNRTATFFDENWEEDGWTLADLLSARTHTALFFDEDWEEDGCQWTLADLFVPTRPNPLVEGSHFKASSAFKNILHKGVTFVPQVELIVICFFAFAVWIELSR
ncbi:hypothetical protein C8F01DRAFT_332622 [Mycena amicta]|nr:hypothetical protein C8F01DRAFT_332622 [Mycena amicta]